MFCMSKTKLYRRAYLGGTFDCLHRGHLALFARANQVAKELVVSLNTDEFAESYKRRPLMSLADRKAVLEQCRLVDTVVINTGGFDSKIAILEANVDCIVHGDDWQGESLMKQMGFTQEWLEEYGIDLVILPYTKDISTSEILNKYAQSDELTTSCSTCHRAVYKTDIDEFGNCNAHSEVWHKPTEEEWTDLGRPEA